jgi:kumamolisin
VHLPNDLVEIVEGVFGLDNRRAARSHAATTPPIVAGQYSFPAGDGTGQTIGILELGGGFAPSDISSYLKGLGLGTPTVNVIPVDKVNNTPRGNVKNVWTNNPGANPTSDPDIEVTLVACAVAQGAVVAVYFAPNSEQGWVDALSQAINDKVNRPSVLSISWGSDENAYTSGASSSVSRQFQAMGVTVFVATGDNGSYDGIPDGNAHVEYPASDAWVTACGGTIINSLSPIIEGTWSSTGGGISSLFGA